MFIDVHCHLELLKDMDEVVETAWKSRVEKIVTAGTSVGTNRMALAFSEQYKEVECVLGIYPDDCLDMNDKEIDKEIEFIRKNKDKIIGIGEIGMDFKKRPDDKIKTKQEEAFRKFISLSKELDLPIVVHSRDAEKECIDILEDMNVEKVIMHCFCGDLNMIKRIEKNGWCFSVPTSICYKKNFEELVRSVEMKYLLCETDSPFMHPEKKFMKNSPREVIKSYQKIAEIKNIDLKDVESEIENNFNTLFE